MMPILESPHNLIILSCTSVEMLRQQSVLRVVQSFQLRLNCRHIHITNASKLRKQRRNFSAAYMSSSAAVASHATDQPVHYDLSASEYLWPIEEETLPGYRAEAYFPAYVGQVLQDRYRIVGKLGFGMNSTVWLSWDDR